MAVNQAMLMAAGLGTRLRPFTEHWPKALFPVLGVPIAQYALDALGRAGVKRVVANIHHHAEIAARELGVLETGGAELLLSDERSLLLGSVGGLRKALPSFGGQPFFLINADVLCDIDLVALAETHQRLRARHGVTLTLAVLEGGQQEGRYRELMIDRGNGLIRGFGELVTGRPFFIGSAILEPECLAAVPDGESSEFLKLVLEPAIRAGHAGFHAFSGSWMDIGAPGLWLEAHVQVLRALERGDLHTAWRERIERGNARVAQETWVSKGSWTELPLRSWGRPAYWDGRSAASPLPPRALGSRAVLYGDLPSGAPELLRDGIGFQNIWVGA